MKGLLLMALAGAMAIPSRVMDAVRAQNTLDTRPEVERQSHFRSGRSHEAKCAARRTYPSLHPKHISRRNNRFGDGFSRSELRAVGDKTNPANMSRSAPRGYRWEFGRLVPRDLPSIRK